MARAEAELIRDILLRVGARPGVRLWRANVGVAVPLHLLCDDCRHLPAVRFGVKGQADLSGIAGPAGRRLEVEAKTGRQQPTEQQRRFGRMVRTQGGIYVVARSVEDVEEVLP